MPPLFFGESAYTIQRDFFRVGPRTQLFLSQTEDTIAWSFQFMELGMEHRIDRTHHLTTTTLQSPASTINEEENPLSPSITQYDDFVITMQEEEDGEEEPPLHHHDNTPIIISSSPSTPPPDGPGIDRPSLITHVDGIPVTSDRHALILIFGHAYLPYLNDLYASHGIELLLEDE
jgi:hypothetical protein